MTDDEKQPELTEMDKAMATAAVASMDPLRMAAENAQLRSSVKGAHALLQALVARYSPGEAITIERADWQAPDPKFELDVRTPNDGSVILRLKPRKNLAIRSKKR